MVSLIPYPSYNYDPSRTTRGGRNSVFGLYPGNESVNRRRRGAAAAVACFQGPEVEDPQILPMSCLGSRLDGCCL